MMRGAMGARLAMATLVLAVSFVGGRLGARARGETAPSGRETIALERASSPARAAPAATGAPPVAPSLAADDATRLAAALEYGLRSPAPATVEEGAFGETAALRADRHSQVEGEIAERLGDVAPATRRALLELNDEATQAQLALQAAMVAGRLGQDDYDAQLRQRVQVQLEQLHALLGDDDYRKLTGLEPGIDPFEYVRTGVGGAREVKPQLVELVSVAGKK